jgi:ribonuclease HI
MSEDDAFTIHTDGASRGNPGAAAYAYVISRDGVEPVEEAGCLGEMTNNQAEYTALVRALEHALELGPDGGVDVFSDSELMVKQMRGEYRVKNEELRGLYEQAKELAGRIPGRVTFRHVRREQNKRADALCNEALDGKREPMPRAAPAKKAPAPPTLREEILACLREEGVKEPEAVLVRLAKILDRRGVRLS